MRRDESEPLGRGSDVEVPGCRPPGKPKKTWRKYAENLAALGIDEEEALNRDSWRMVIEHLTS